MLLFWYSVFWRLYRVELFGQSCFAMNDLLSIAPGSYLKEIGLGFIQTCKNLSNCIIPDSAGIFSLKI